MPYKVHTYTSIREHSCTLLNKHSFLGHGLHEHEFEGFERTNGHSCRRQQEYQTPQTPSGGAGGVKRKLMPHLVRATHQGNIP